MPSLDCCSSAGARPKPEATHFQLRIIWLLSIVTSPSSREAARMADERPLNSVQFVVGYFDTEPF
ncbi:hypothetical protein BV289_11285, partial [Lactiplantibacillus plantarum]